ncbi:MAG TPA: tetratricopeptide repeat protein [Longimicrobium sp.]|jgi:glycosyltransferase involved in cell wall biosynthesis
MMPMETQQVLRRVIAFATGWGSDFGGINVFSTRFLEQMAFACKEQVTVVCVVPTLPSEHETARDVKLVQLPYPPVGGKLDAAHARAAVEALASEGISLDAEGLVWLGHDRITGEIALEARAIVGGGRTALIHHMSYEHYEAYAERSEIANVKGELQRKLFAEADVRMAVGPLLRDALEDLVPNTPVTMLVPGLDELAFFPAPKRFVAFMSGRFSADAAKIKQGHLGVAAFAEAHRRASSEPLLPELLKNQPQLIMRGVDIEPERPPTSATDVEYWAEFAEAYADRVVTIHALPYTTRRKDLLDQLARATVALMPSWHEGFGLAGWEAVAAGVPLIVSKQSGLFRFLEEESAGGWLNWVYPVDVQGSLKEPFFHANDLNNVSERLIEIARDPDAARSKAARLREALSAYTWKRCVDSALEGLGWANVEVPIAENNSSTAALVEATATPAPSTSPLDLPQSRWQPGSGLADSQLLRAEEAAVAFDPAREPDVGQLVDWAHNPEYPQALRLLTASGGAGKTRLALELCARMTNRGWHCGMLRSDIGPANAANAWLDLAARNQPVLAVFDYAETRQETLLAFLRAMLNARRTKVVSPVRILLLARDGGEWWDRLSSRDSTVEPFLGGYATSGPVALLPLHREKEARGLAFQAALDAYATRMGIAEMPDLNVDLSGEHFERPLYIQIAALLALRGERPASAEGLTKALLHHERRYWARLLQEGLGSTSTKELDDRHAAELMTLATLAGGFIRPADARKVWEAWDGSIGRNLTAGEQRLLFERLASLYPGQQGLQPLRPDLLGEALVAYSLLQRSGERLFDALLDPARGTAHRRGALTVVARLSNHRPDIESAVVQSLTRKFVPCATDLVNVATQSDSLLPKWAEQAFTRLSPPSRAQVVGVLLPLMKDESVQLAQLACAVSEAEVEKIKVKLQRKPQDWELRADLARALVRLSIKLARAGRSGLLPGKQSVQLSEELASQKPGRFEPDLARSLGVYANRLAEHGEVAEALAYDRKALAIRERLAAKDADYETELAACLSNYGIRLGESGEAAEALAHHRKALDIHKRLASKNPTQFEPDLGSLLSNYAARLSESGQVAEALAFDHSALEIHERLAAKNPDRFEPELARSFSNYAIHLSESGRLVEALTYDRRALEIRRRLAAKNPDRFEHDLAFSLHNVAMRLSENGTAADALIHAVAALQIRERLAAGKPLRYAEDAYISLLNVQWLKWLASDGTAEGADDLPSPDPRWCKPHRLPLLEVYREWLQACNATDQSDRAVALANILEAAESLSTPEFRSSEAYWLCAAAWCEKFAPGAAHWVRWSRWRVFWSDFLSQRGGKLPWWMTAVAERMGFRWPPAEAPLI